MYRSFTSKNHSEFVNFYGFILEHHIGAFFCGELVAVLSFRYRTEDEIFVHTLFVKDEFRRLGIAKKLMKHLFSLCKRRNIDWIILRVAKVNTNAIALYKLLNFLSTAIDSDVFEMVLETSINK
jgi:ribosomal protein S18 acetylase RimI-like enzyme